MKKPNIAFVAVGLVLTILLGTVLDRTVFSKLAAVDTNAAQIIRPAVRTPVRVTSFLSAQLSPNTPVSRIVVTSPEQVTSNVVLGVYSVRSQYSTSTLKYVNFNINNTSAVPVGSIMTNIRLIDSNKTYGSIRVSANEVAFTNLSVILPTGQWKDLMVVADIAPAISQVTASTALIASSLRGVDSAGREVSSIQAVNVTANDVKFIQGGLSVSSGSTVIGSAITYMNTIVGYNVSFKFTLLNASNNDLYVPKVPASLLSTSSVGSTYGSSASTTISYISVSPDAMAADTSRAYVIPAGMERSFVANGRLSPASAGIQSTILRITGINYNSSAADVDIPLSPTAGVIKGGLGNLVGSVTF